ncbi:MAG: tRNA (adenosine(37)-N6)-threonylcarbamoyltransferase complex dimerization subunit type 1 TsaB [Syntrophus sp. (in: bacteria)]|nr:tRNA (adenosine(37)-N6)-threonylcarbamoyltransferase complex dimerization subunit type 1 TsaB [Syntrophus sp. (in: bacteria)]
MLILAVDNSLDFLTIAVADGKRILEEKSVKDAQNTPSEILAGMVSDMLTDTGHRIDDIGAIFVTLGPGSFTGIRVSLAFCKGISSAKKIPLIGVPTLDVLALHFAHMDEHFLCPLIDAKKGEVFLALYFASKGKLKRLTNYQAVKPEAVVGMVQKPCICFGSGMSLCEPFLTTTEGVQIEKDMDRKISAEAFIGAGMLAMAESPKGNIKPIYGRKSEAEIRYNVTVD